MSINVLLKKSNEIELKNNNKDNKIHEFNNIGQIRLKRSFKK